MAIGIALLVYYDPAIDGWQRPACGLLSCIFGAIMGIIFGVGLHV